MQRGALKAGASALIAILLSACGAGAVFETNDGFQERVDEAVQQALERERGWQTRFVERRTETMIEDQRALAERIRALEARATQIANRVDEIRRAAPVTANYVATDPDRQQPVAQAPTPAPAPVPAAPTPVSPQPVTPPINTEEIASLRTDLQALIAAMDRLRTARGESNPVLRARLERLEYRTSRIAWPPAEGAPRGVHLASYRNRAAAMVGWKTLTERYPDLMDGREPALVEIDTVSGRFVRLFTAAGSPEAELLEIRDALRAGGDYAAVLPMTAAPDG